MEYFGGNSFSCYNPNIFTFKNIVDGFNIKERFKCYNVKNVECNYIIDDFVHTNYGFMVRNKAQVIFDTDYAKAKIIIYHFNYGYISDPDVEIIDAKYHDKDFYNMVNKLANDIKNGILIDNPLFKF